MDAVLLVALFGVMHVLLSWDLWREERKRVRDWTRLAEAAGLTAIKQSRPGTLASVLRASAGPLQVRLERYARERERGTRITIGGLGHGYAQLSLCEEGLHHRTDPQAVLVLGDEPFEAAFTLRGSPELACVLLGAQARHAISVLARDCLVRDTHPRRPPRDRVLLQDDVLRVDLGDAAPSSLEAALPRVLEIARMLARPPELVGRLAQNLRQEPVAAVRLSNLRILLERHAEHPQAREAFVEALGDRSEEVRLRAALALGERGRQTLFAIASSDQSDDQRAARAITALGEHLSAERAKSILGLALRIRRLATAEACVDALGLRGGRDAIDLLTTVLVTERWALAAAAARALAATGEAAAETPLLEALIRDSPPVRVAVARALERVGTAAAVMPLREASERLREGEFRHAARQAIAAIQARLRGAWPGQLSLAAGDTGQLSLIAEDDVRGRLSPPDKA